MYDEFLACAKSLNGDVEIVPQTFYASQAVIVVMVEHLAF